MPTNTCTTQRCPPRSALIGLNSRRIKALEKRLQEILKAQGAKISHSKIREFASSLAQCEDRWKREKKFLRMAHRLPRTDILFRIREAQQSMGLDETLWRCFLACHFGRLSADNATKTQSATRMLCAFGPDPYWTWTRVISSTHSLRIWLIENREELKSLGFGNHRKYEARKPRILYRVISGFIDWVKDRGGTPSSAFRTSSHSTSEKSFDRLFHSFKCTFRFGRTGTFDLLCLLGNMAVLSVRPASCYLLGSTGPLSGARKLWGRRRPLELSQLADSTARALKISFDVFEDSLCMWQKYGHRINSNS
jgi:Alpha-glutamyl/putrescinyl thymine pyrophosphorylase clade 3